MDEQVIEPRPDADEAGPPVAPTPPAHEESTALPVGAQKLDPRWISMRRVAGWVGVAVHLMIWIIGTLILVFAGIPGWVLALAVGGWALLVVFFAIRAHVWPALSWRHAAYRVSERDLEIRRGVIWREVVTVPRSRVQHTDVSQGPIERSFGLGTLLIHTAGTDHSRIVLPGLAHQMASTIRDHLVEVDEDDGV